ncbi:glycosyl transferase family 2 [Nibricoccus aquaticus]|uniref:Glycosyl transferase family 2 n=1 Tax=Nibricoccus aquaticus TaxID=2576891 RepID=A0A290QL89_9BACT|nr:glycosyltransferase family 2 protein [Nibricoccus aquaticus]ATC64732.1 glycosyl transferase family 2 [Nibricoccus aquaticus]
MIESSAAMSMTPVFSVVLPCYNESETLPQLFSRFDEVLEGRNDLEVVFVNNGSKDNSSDIFAIQLAQPGRQWARLVDVTVNQGYGFGILAGLRATQGKFIGWTHADSQYDPHYVVEGFKRLIASPRPDRTILQGRRVGRNAFDAFFTAGMTLLSCLALGIRVSDVNAQPKLFPRALFDEVKNPPHDFSLDLYMLFLGRRLGYSIERMPVVFARRTFGEAKGGAGSLRLKWKLIKRTWAFIGQLRRDIRTGKL